MLKKVFLLLVVVFMLSKADATHLMGGEISWECLSTGQYRFHMKIYKDCNGGFPVTGNGADFYLDVLNHPSVTQIPMNIIDSIDITPNCNVQGPVYSCSGTLGPGAHMEINFASNPITLSGVPPSAGWIFSWGRNCCRNNCILNLNSPNTYGITLRAIMFPYQARNANPCFDSSPVFAQRPTIVLCGAYPMQYNHNSFDPDLDTLEYSWAQPLQQYAPQGGTGTFSMASNCPFNTANGYSLTSPFPGTSVNPLNVPATLNSQTGQISFTSYTYGCFVTVLKVSAYKCGIKVAEIYRDIQVMVLNCGGNVPPTVTPPFAGGTSFDTTVVAGATVDFMLLATDSGWDPSFAFNQWITFTASGAQFDTNFTSTTSGCLNPPCATLLPYPFPIRQLRDSVFFNWQTSCDHINYGNQPGGPCTAPVQQNKYTFVITAKDDYCPAPDFKVSTINITVLGLPLAGTPELRCASVLPNGDVQLTWIPPIDPGGTFADYYILSATSAAGPYVAIDSSINILATNTFTHSGANANTTPRFYSIRSRSGCYGKVQSYPSDTLQAILLDVTNPGSGFADLSWNALRNPLLPSSTGWYKIYRKINAAGAWALIDSTQNIIYSDPLFKCNDTVSYRIEIDDSAPCTSVSSVDVDVFFDNTPPAVPILDSVSIDPLTNFCLIGWQPDSSIDTRGYLVYHWVGNPQVNVLLDTVFGINNTFYTTTFAATGSEYFRLVAYDSCMNLSPFGIRHRTLWLTAQLNSCLQGAELAWNSYLNWQGGVTGYEIYSSENGAAFSLIATVSGNDTTYFHAPINQNSTYRYYVHAIGAGGSETSTSNYATLVAYVIKLPRYLYIRTATVSEQVGVRVDLYVDTTADVSAYKIIRSSELTGVYDTIATATASQLISFVSVFDSSANTSQQSYFYKAVAIDVCRVGHLSDNYGRTIFLTAKTNDDLTNSIYWNDYADWSGGVEKYELYRNVSGIWETNPFANVDFNSNTYRDDISQFITSDGKFCYYIKAFEGIGNTYGFSDTSLSNVVCVIQGPRLYTPNAFTPGGRNPVFYPINAFIDITSFQFIVLNRWGQTVLETTDRAQGWDGTYQGQDAPPGVYVYVLRLTGTNGKLIERKGTITLIR